MSTLAEQRLSLIRESFPIARRVPPSADWESGAISLGQDGLFLLDDGDGMWTLCERGTLDGDAFTVEVIAFVGFSIALGTAIAATRHDCHGPAGKSYCESCGWVDAP